MCGFFLVSEYFTCALPSTSTLKAENISLVSIVEIFSLQSGQHSRAASGKTGKGSGLSTVPGAQSALFLFSFSSLIVLYLKIDSGLCFPWSRLGDIGATNGWGILSSTSNDRHHRHPSPHRHYHHRHLSIGPRTALELG